MKKEKIEQPVLCYEDENFMIQTRQQLEQARQSLQILLNEWQKLENIGECSDLHELLLRPEQAYKKGINSTVEKELPVTSGKYSLNIEKFKEGLNLPDPGSMYSAAKAAQREPFAAVEPLWQIVNNEVQLIDSEAKSLIESQNIYLTDEKQINFVQRITNMVNAINEADPMLPGLLLTDPLIRQRLGASFKIYDEGGWPGRPKIEINPDLLRRWIRGIS